MEEKDNILLQKGCGAHTQQATRHSECGIKKSSSALGLNKTLESAVATLWDRRGRVALLTPAKPACLLASSERGYGKQALNVASFVLHISAEISFPFPWRFFISLIISDGVKARPLANTPLETHRKRWPGQKQLCPVKEMGKESRLSWAARERE